MERLDLTLIERQRKGRRKRREDGKKEFDRSIRDEHCITRKFQHGHLEGL